MKKKFGFTVVVASLAVALGSLCFLYQTSAEDKANADKASAVKAGAQDKKPPEKKPALQKFMRAKLEHSQKVLDGLVTEDFELIEKHAQAMLLLAIAEEWKVSNDPLYTQHSQEFRRTVKQIGKMAKDRNLDGASLAFMQLTMNCIECHRFVRNQLIAGE